MRRCLTLGILFMFIQVCAAELLIGDFEKPDSVIHFWTSRDERWGGPAAAETVPLYATRGANSLKAVFKGNAKDSWPYCDFTFNRTNRDLSRWKFLRFDVFNPGEPVTLQGRFTAEDADGKEVLLWPGFKIKSGMNSLAIAISPDSRGVFAKGGGKTVFPWKNVRTLNFFLNSPRHDVTLFIDNVRFDDGTEPVIQAQSAANGIGAVRFSSPPVIDGTLDDPCWKEMLKSGKPPVFLNNRDSGAAKQPTFALAGYDDDTLYIAVVCSESAPGKLRRKCELYEAPVCNDDSVEIFVSTGQKPGEYFQFITNTDKGRYDGAAIDGLYCAKRNPSWKHAVRIGEKEWILEAAIPFSDLRFYKGLPFDWRINIARNASVQPELTALFPTGGNLHMPHKFGPLKGMNPDTSKYGLRVESLDPGKGIPGRNTAKIVVDAFSVKPGAEYLLKLRLEKADGGVVESSRTVALQPGKQACEIPYKVDLPGSFTASGIVCDMQGRSIALFPPAHFTSASPVELSFLKPHYKDAVFATQKLKEAECLVRLNLEESAITGMSLKMTLSRDGKGILEKVLAVPQTGEVRWNFDVESLPAGNYRASAELKNADGAVIGRAERTLRKLSPHPNEVRIDENARLLINGKPVFPMTAWYGFDFDIKKSAGFNANYVFGGWKPLEKEAEMIRDHAEAGMPVFVSIAAATIQENYFKETPFDSVKGKLETLVKGYRDVPGLFGYEILDEPQCYFNEPLACWVKAKDLLDELDPYHPVRITQNAEGTMSASYLKVCDIYAMDYYPGYVKGGLSRHDLSNTALRVRNLRKILPSHVPVIPVLQAYERLAAEGFPNGRYADYREHRLLCYSSIAEGANGIEFWCYSMGYYSRMPDRIEWFGIRTVVRELAAMSEVFLAEDVPSSSPDAGNETHFRLKKWKGDFYFIAANSSLKERILHFDSPALKEVRSLAVLGENRNVSVADGRFSDTFGKYAVHIYTTAKNPPSIGGIAANEKEEKRIYEEFEKKNASDLFYAARHRGTLKVVPAEGLDKYSWLNMFDGMENSYWQGKKSSPYTFEVSTGRPESIGRLLIECRDSSPESAEVLGRINGGWETLARKDFQGQSLCELVFAPRKVEAVRVVLRSANGKPFRIDNLRAFEK